MNSLVKFVVASVAGLGVGVFSAQALIDGYGNLFNKSYGPWVSWPTAGTRSSNPYVRAHYLNHNRLPISQFEVNELEARTDSNGEPLDGKCTYEITGKMPQTRWWSIYTFANGSANTGNSAHRTGISSQQMFYQTSDAFLIKLSSDPQTGNWLVPASDGDFVLVLRHYNPGRSISNQFKFENLPVIKKRACS